jgi:hypothetical protein
VGCAFGGRWQHRGTRVNKLPPHLAAILRGRGVAKADVPVVVAQLEQMGYHVQVRRLQLGSIKQAGFGQIRIVYETAKQEREKGN